MNWTLEAVAELDRNDPLAPMRERFDIPEGLIYLDGNSLGALPRATPDVIQDVVRRQWGEDLIRSWNTNGWMDLPLRTGNRIAGLIGASPGEVISADSTSVNLFKMIIAALRLRPDRTRILTEDGNFPTDRYIMQGIADLLGREVEFHSVPAEHLMSALDDRTAVLSLTHVNFRTGAVHDMSGLNARAHDVGALTVWDLSHSAGALPVNVSAAEADFAVGCGYKFFNGGPGAPAFLYVSGHLASAVRPPLSGWMGHVSPFEFGPDYRPAEGIMRNLCGTPGVLGLASLEAGLKTFDGAALLDIREKSMVLGDLFLDLVEARCQGHGFEIGCPRDSQQRGSQVSLLHEQAYPIVQALIAERVIGDMRKPNVMRFGLAPLYLRYQDIWDAVDVLARVMEEELWRKDDFQVEAAVT